MVIEQSSIEQINVPSSGADGAPPTAKLSGGGRQRLVRNARALPFVALAARPPPIGARLCGCQTARSETRRGQLRDRPCSAECRACEKLPQRCRLGALAYFLSWPFPYVATAPHSSLLRNGGNPSHSAGSVAPTGQTRRIDRDRRNRRSVLPRMAGSKDEAAN